MSYIRCQYAAPHSFIDISDFDRSALCVCVRARSRCSPSFVSPLPLISARSLAEYLLHLRDHPDEYKCVCLVCCVLCPCTWVISFLIFVSVRISRGKSSR